jgi:type II secretory pathway predicted ATPase ExeA
MSEPLFDQIMRKIGQTADLYHRLLMVVAPSGAGKTATLQDVHAQTGAPLLNINLIVSQRKLPSGGLIEIGTKDQHTVLYFSHIVIDKVKIQDQEQAEKFLSSLLDEAKKEKMHKLFDPIKEFKDGKA